MKNIKNDSYSPNYILACCIVSVFFIVLACGQTLWVPASRIENLYTRSIVLSVTNTLSALASSIGTDRYVPDMRNAFLQISGLSSHTSWDTRYYNRRTDLVVPVPVEPEISPAVVLPVVSSSVVSAFEAAPPDLDIPEMEAVVLSEPVENLPESVPSFNQIHSKENPLKVFMFGDSQVFSLGSGLSRIAGKDSPINVEFLAIHSSGFIRGDYYNWPAKLSDTLRDNAYQGAVMMLGMNDFQSFWNNRGEIMKKQTPEWEAAYKDKCRKLIDIALASVPRLYWIGMPVVKNREYNANLAYIDSVQDSLAQEYSPDMLVRISLQKTKSGETREYCDSIDLGEGKTLKIMSDDGAHFTVEGGQLAMAPLFDRFVHDYLFSELPAANLP